MILQSLCKYYDQLLETHPDEVSKPGWCPRRVSFMLDLSSQGELRGVIPSPDDKGWQRNVPEQVKRSSGVAANFLCDNSSYLLGIAAKSKPERALRCFEAARDLHFEVLADADSAAARAIRGFFESWDPAAGVDLLRSLTSVDVAERLITGGNLEFSVRGERVLNDPVVRDAWERFKQAPSEDASVMTCLVTGERSPIARLHPAIKGVYGAQPTGASLVGFNAPAFEHYGHDGEQGLNAPVGERTVFAYTTALNYLLSDKKHHMLLGDTTVVYWAERHDDACSQAFSVLMDGAAQNPDQNPDEDIDAIMQRIRSGKPVEGVDLEETFYVLGLAPNAARLSVRFFYSNTFGEVLENLAAHYERLEIAANPGSRRFLTPYMLLREIEAPSSKTGNKSAGKKAKTSALAASLMRSILSGSPYPEELFTGVMNRIRVTQDDISKNSFKVTRGKAAIIKAYLLQNRKMDKEVITVELNENYNELPYLLGRLFFTMEHIQRTANPSIKTTIKNRYFNSASMTPAKVFPSLIRKTEASLATLGRESKGLSIILDKQFTSLSAMISRAAEKEGSRAFPVRLDMVEQGSFCLGYYEQKQDSIDRRAGFKPSEDDQNNQED